MVRKVYIETYGCWLNKADSRVMYEVLRKKGFELADSIDDADVVILNTCAVRSDTERKMLRRISEVAQESRRKHFKLVVTGCLTPIRGATIKDIAPMASLLSPLSLDRIAEAVEREEPLVDVSPLKRRRCEILPTYSPEVDGVVHIIPLCIGCLGNCAFCIEPYVKRYLSSCPPEKVIENVKDAVSRGAKLIVLTGQDVAAYGRDLSITLADLVHEILEKVEGEYWLRLGMMEPRLVLEMLDDLLEVYSDRRVMKYLHLPLQSGDDQVLRKMRRKYTVDEYLEIVRKFRTKFPELTLATDIIVGFPGEDEEAFQNTLKVLRKCVPDKVHVARYTMRPFTPAALEKQVPEPVKRRRSREASKVAEELALMRNKLFLSKVLQALVIQEEKHAVARAYNNKPVILDSPAECGKFVNVKINSFTAIDLRGTAIR